MNNRRMILCAALCFAALNLASAENTCSTKTTAGRYAVKCDGFLSPGPNAPLLPAKILATASSDASGNHTGTGQISVGGGPALPQTVSGTATINPDCTGSIVYHQTIGGNPVPDLNVSFVILDHGDRILGQSTDAGAVISCELIRMSK